MTEEILSFLGYIAHHPSSDFHGRYDNEVATARRLLKEAGGELREVGRFRADSFTPMSHEEYDGRKMERVLEALEIGPVYICQGNVLDQTRKTLCTSSELLWIRRMLAKRRVFLLQKGSALEIPKRETPA